MRLSILLAMFTTSALAAPAVPQAPDFDAPPPAHAVAAEHAASHGTAPIEPSDEVLFAPDSASLGPRAQEQIARAARWLHDHPAERIVLEGHTDRSASDTYNEDLATRRAKAVRDHLMAYEVPVDRIVLITCGEQGAGSQPHALDRRVVMFATPDAVATIVQGEMAHRHALAAVWTDGTNLFAQRRGAPTTQTARR